MSEKNFGQTFRRFSCGSWDKYTSRVGFHQEVKCAETVKYFLWNVFAGDEFGIINYSLIFQTVRFIQFKMSQLLSNNWWPVLPILVVFLEDHLERRIVAAAACYWAQKVQCLSCSFQLIYFQYFTTSPFSCFCVILVQIYFDLKKESFVVSLLSSGSHWRNFK